MTPTPFQLVLVLGSLTQFFGMRKVNTIGIKQANKVMMLAATAYNLKKYLKLNPKTVQSIAKSVSAFCFQIIEQIELI